MQKTQIIELLGGTKVLVNFDESRVKCRGCGAWIRFGITQKNHKFIPIIEVIQVGEGEVGWQAHFADCENAANFRRK